ncbi:unnamed protein product [Adineta ricciae]|uniref:Uncharacterized protein n=1 Tax=Adineta ricciae TaxID=249248 RepID=A0A814AV41_ADIRI|nr:unnamed protein product [Adineta ricciae]
MFIKPQTKMMRMVCKQASSMREPYRNPPWLTHAGSNVDRQEKNVKKETQTPKSINKKTSKIQATSSIRKDRTSNELKNSNKVTAAVASNKKLPKI